MQTKEGQKEFGQTRGQNSMTSRYGVTSEHCAKHCRSAGCWRVLEAEAVDRQTQTFSHRDFQIYEGCGSRVAFDELTGMVAPPP